MCSVRLFKVKSRVKMRPEVLHIRVGLPGAGVVQLRGSSNDLGGDDQGPAGGDFLPRHQDQRRTKLVQKLDLRAGFMQSYRFAVVAKRLGISVRMIRRPSNRRL